MIIHSIDYFVVGFFLVAFCVLFFFLLTVTLY